MSKTVIASAMPATNGGFTMGVWRAEDVPVGSVVGIVSAPAVANGAAELPEPLEEVRAKFRGEWDYVEAGDRYYTQAQIIAYGQACAKAATATNPLSPNALLVAALEGLLSYCEEPGGMTVEIAMDQNKLAEFVGALDEKRDELIAQAHAALASVPTAPEAS